MSADDATEAIDVSASGGDDANGVRRLASVERGRPRFVGVTIAEVDGPTRPRFAAVTCASRSDPDDQGGTLTSAASASRVTSAASALANCRSAATCAAVSVSALDARAAFFASRYARCLSAFDACTALRPLLLGVA